MIASKISLLLLFIGSLAWAHGENKPGPNGGHVRMPGAFHTELIQGDDGSFHVFLLDGEFKNPTTKDSLLEMKFLSAKNEIKFACAEMGGSHFHCKAPSKIKGRGNLVLNAKRDGMQGNEATYKFPLSKFKTSKGDHSHHH